MPLIIITLSLIFISIIIFTWIQLDLTKKAKLLKHETLEKLSTYGKVYKEGLHTLFDYKDETFELLFYRVRQNSELTINSRTIWEIRDAGSSSLVDQSAFLSSPYKKIIIIYPSTLVIKRYINENEMEFVKINKSFYDMYVLRAFELDQFLSSELS